MVHPIDMSLAIKSNARAGMVMTRNYAEGNILMVGTEGMRVNSGHETTRENPYNQFSVSNRRYIVQFPSQQKEEMRSAAFRATNLISPTLGRGAYRRDLIQLQGRINQGLYKGKQLW